MSKQFITTATAGSAHKADIYSVAVSKPYTITASGDGYLKFWKNAVTEVDTAKEHVEELFVHKSGLHHVDVFEDVIDSVKHVLIAAVAFNGEIYFSYVDSDGQIKLLEGVTVEEEGKGKDSYWAIKWLKDSKGQVHRLAATQPTGTTKIWNFEISPEGIPSFKLHGNVKSQNKSFATTLDLSSNESLLATGFQNGDVVLTHLETAKPIYTFHNFGLKGSSQSSSAVRTVKFSPLGTLLAVGADSGSYGTITIYDTTYGESVGGFTIPTHSSSVSVGAYAHEGWVFEVDFNETGESLASAGYDGKVRIWNVTSREREATTNLSVTDVDDSEIDEQSSDDVNACSAFGVKFIARGIRGGAGADSNDGLVVIGKDRAIRWYREAGGI